MEYTPLPASPRLLHLLVLPFGVLAALLVAVELAVEAPARPMWQQLAQAAWFAGWGAWVAWLSGRSGIDLRRLVGRPPRRREAWGYVAMAVPLLLFSVGLVWLLTVVASWAAPGLVRGLLAEEAPAAAPPGAPLAAAVEVLVLVALAPVVEETVFRGVLLHGWGRRWGHTRAILATAALFALLHPVDLVGTFVFGVVLAVIRLRTGTLLVPIACHALYNALTALIGAGDTPAPGPGTAESAAFSLRELRSMWWVGAAAVAAALPVILVFLRRNLPRLPAPEPPGA